MSLRVCLHRISSSAIRCPPSAIRCPPSPIRCPPSAIRYPPSAIRNHRFPPLPLYFSASPRPPVLGFRFPPISTYYTTRSAPPQPLENREKKVGDDTGKDNLKQKNLNHKICLGAEDLRGEGCVGHIIPSDIDERLGGGGHFLYFPSKVFKLFTRISEKFKKKATEFFSNSLVVFFFCGVVIIGCFVKPVDRILKGLKSVDKTVDSTEDTEEEVAAEDRWDWVRVKKFPVEVKNHVFRNFQEGGKTSEELVAEIVVHFFRTQFFLLITIIVAILIS